MWSTEPRWNFTWIFLSERHVRKKMYLHLSVLNQTQNPKANKYRKTNNWLLDERWNLSVRLVFRCCLSRQPNSQNKEGKEEKISVWAAIWWGTMLVKNESSISKLYLQITQVAQTKNESDAVNSRMQWLSVWKRTEGELEVSFARRA